MRLIIVSGLSGSGKSVALNLLEDMDFYCIDNVPAMLMEPMLAEISRTGAGRYVGLFHQLHGEIERSHAARPGLGDLGHRVAGR